MPALTDRWELAHDPLFRQIVRSGEAMAQPEWGHGVHVQVEGWRLTRRYPLPLHAGPGREQHGPLPHGARARQPAQRLRLAYASCQRWEHGYYGAWRQVVQARRTWCSSWATTSMSTPRPHITLGLARTHNLRAAQSLQDYRDRYALHKSDPLLQAAPRHVQLVRGLGRP